MPKLYLSFKALMGLSLLVAPAASTAMPEKGGEKQADKMICKKILETGSLVKKTKVCLTRSQWERSATRGQDYGRDLQESLRTRPAGGT